jgi:hypothetical protein
LRKGVFHADIGLIMVNKCVLLPPTHAPTHPPTHPEILPKYLAMALIIAKDLRTLQRVFVL